MSKIKLNPITDEEYGAVKVPRSWAEIFSVLLERFDLDYHGFPNKQPRNSQITETEKFLICPGYDWDCSCGTEDEENGDMNCEHDENCDLLKPNFLYKPTGFKLYWYKYPMRGSTMLPGITTAQFMEIILDCLKEN